MQSIRSSMFSLCCYRGQSVAPGIRWFSKKIGGNNPQDLFNTELNRLASQQKSLSQSVMTLNKLLRAMPTQTQDKALLKIASANTTGWEISSLEGSPLALASLKFTAPRDGLDQRSTESETVPANCQLAATDNPPAAKWLGDIMLPEQVISYPEGISEAHLSPSGEFFLIARRDILEIWGKTEDGQWAQQGSLQHRNLILRACFNARENAVLSRSLGGQVKILGKNSDGTWSEHAAIKFDGNSIPLVFARFSHSGDHMLITNARISNSEVQIWGRDAHGQWLNKARICDAMPDCHGQTLSAGLTLSDRHIFTKAGSMAQIWSSASNWRRPLKVHHNDTVLGTFLSANECHALTFDRTGVVKLFDYQQEWLEAGEINHGTDLAEAIVSDDGRFVLTVGDNSNKESACKIWHHAGSWYNLASITHNGGVKFARFLPDNHVVACGHNGKVVIWSRDGYGREEMVRVEHTGQTTSVVISPSGKQLLTCSDDGTAKLMHCDQQGFWSEQAVIQHQGDVLGGSFSLCGNSVLTFGKDCTARLWARDDSGHWQERAVIHHNNTINGAQFSPSGNLAITFSQDGTAVVCSRLSEQNWQERRVITHGAPVRAVKINASEEWIVTTGSDFDHKVWFCDRDGIGREVLMMPSVRWVEFGQGQLLTVAQDDTAVVWSIDDSNS